MTRAPPTAPFTICDDFLFQTRRVLQEWSENEMERCTAPEINMSDQER